MNRKERRARKSKGLDNSPDVVDPTLWNLSGPYKSPPPEPKEEAIPGVTVPPIDITFDQKVRNNSWHDRSELPNVISTIQTLSREDNREWSWARNSACKYVDIRIDMRDGAFVLMNRDGERINLEQLKWQYRSAK